jgi:outer membrane receptor for ferrienterochelin and colicin
MPLPIHNTPVALSIEGKADLRPEITVSTELGYRYLHPRWQLDLSYFVSELDDVVSVFLKDPNQPRCANTTTFTVSASGAGQAMWWSNSRLSGR